LLKLKRVEIQGFKSFYDRTEMKFNGSGIAAIVGPNGCGKSNLSDAISWVLGEQSAKSLRGARMEDVIFAGTRDRKPLGMAYVTMTLVPDESVLQHPHHAPAESSASVSGLVDIAADGINQAAAPIKAVLAECTPIEATAEARLESPPETVQVIHVADVNGNGHSNGHANGHVFLSEATRAADHMGEITITRRLYRSGESEYLINGKTARLRDIQELFLGTGLGPESYAIIEQGRIGQILSNKPQDRRSVIEESAGITKFKARKRLAEARLESAKQNLSRVFDILEEVTRQVNSLKRQAAKTKRYGELRAEMIDYLRQVLASKFKLLESETARTAIELNLASNELNTIQTTVAEKEFEQSQSLEALYALEKELTGVRQQLADTQLEAERTRGKLEYQVRQIEQISQGLAKSDVEALELGRQETESCSELEQQNADAAILEAEHLSAREFLNAKGAERQQAQARLSDRERTLEASRQQILRLINEASGLQNRMAQADAQLASSERESKRAKQDSEQAETDSARILAAKDQLSERLVARQDELGAVTEHRRAVEQELHARRAALNETRQALDRFRAEHSRIKARRDSLGEVLSHRTYTTETVKRLFTAIEQGKAHGMKPVGVLADFLEVDPQFEKATEEFLHEELEFVVVKDWSDAEQGIDLLRTDLDGRATFLVENYQGSNSDEARAAHRPQSEEGIVTSLGAALRFSNGLSHAPLQLLPRVANCFLTSERNAAQRLAVQYPDCFFLAPDGVSYHGHAVSGGKKTGSGPLALKRELREVTELERSKLEQFQGAQANLASIEEELVGLNEQLEVLRGQQQGHEKEVLALDHESRKLAEEFQRVNGRLLSGRAELERIARDQASIEERLGRDREELQIRENSRAGMEQEFETAREELHVLQTEVAQLSEDHSTLRASLASSEERHRAITATRTRTEARMRDVANRRATLLRESERLVAERARLQASNAELSAQAEQLAQLAIETDSNARQLAQQESGSREHIGLLEEKLKTLRSNGQVLQDSRSELQVALARLESDLKHLDQTANNELATSLAELSSSIDTTPDEAAVAEIDAKYLEVRRKIEALGPINPQALEEFEESQQRHDFLQTQRQDLLDSIRDTEKAIQEIDVESRKRFGEAFHAINTNFKEMFRNLFGGGIGEMRLTDEENLAESGIDIVASPPGKKLQNVLLLSGGEKSLTAMALLMSIFQYTPSPFCILDEIDAPLDEPNIERLTKLLRDMSEQTQFIVITHAKRTMEAAQSLYGVTMQEPGISKLVSVKFKPQAEVDGNRSAAQPNRQPRERVYETVGA
jgi:chromosome segregation protein